MFSSDFNHVELVDVPDAVRVVLEDRLNHDMHVPFLGAIAPAGNIRARGEGNANALQRRRFNSDICLPPRHQPAQVLQGQIQ
jgi:hypothetical protein